MSEPPRSKRQRQAAATAEQLLSAARDVFETRGFVATTVGAITETANTAHGTFYLYFRNKEEAFAKVVEHVIAGLYQGSEAPDEADPQHALETAIHNYLALFSAHGGLWRCLMEGTHQSQAVEDMWRDLRRPFIDRIARGLEPLVRSGAVRPLDVEVAAHALGSMVEWTAYVHVVHDEPSQESCTLDQFAHTLSDLWFHAVFGRIPDGMLAPVRGGASAGGVDGVVDGDHHGRGEQTHGGGQQ
jgi:AcrR family transcriptional regulator